MRSTIKLRWLIYTVAVGLIPLAIRALIYLCTREATLGFALNASDLVALGLVVSVTNLNEIDRVRVNDERWKEKCKGISIVAIVLFAGMLMMADMAELGGSPVIMERMKWLLILLNFAILSISASLYDRLARIEDAAQSDALTAGTALDDTLARPLNPAARVAPGALGKEPNEQIRKKANDG